MIKETMKPALSTFLFFAITFIVACGGGPTSAPTGDATAPERGGQISFADIKYNEITLQLAEASDNVTSRDKLQYRVVRASSFAEINTIGECSAIEGAGVIMEWGNFVPSINVPGLVQETVYWFSVLVRDEAGNINIYYPQQVRTIANTAPTPGSPLSFSNRTDTSLRVTWGAATDSNYASTLLRYRLVKAASAGAIDTVEEVEKITGGDLLLNDVEYPLFHDVTGLTKSTRYYFAVMVNNPEGKKSIYSPKMTTTLDDVIPVPGGEVYSSSKTSSSLTVRWPAATDNLTPQSELSYLWVMATVESDIDTIAEVEAAAPTGRTYVKNLTTATVTGLATYSEYYFAVVVKDEHENKNIYLAGSPAHAKMLRTSGIWDPVFPADSKIEPTVGGIDETSIEVSWPMASDDDLGGVEDALEYRLVRASGINLIDEPEKAAGNGLGVDVVMDWTPGGSLTWDVSDRTSRIAQPLVDGTTYHFAVVVRDLDGNMALCQSAAGGIQTLDGTAPTPGEMLPVSEIRSTSMRVKWSEASDLVSKSTELKYRLVIASSSAAIDSVAKLLAISATFPGTLPGIAAIYTPDWADYPADGVDVKGLTLGNTYHFAVLVKDEAGNASNYTPISGTTSQSWEPVGQAGFADTYNDDDDSVSIKICSGVPYVAYLDNTTGVEGYLTVKKYHIKAPDTTENWHSVGTAGFSGEAAISVDLEVMSDSEIYVAYQTGTDGKGKVMKYDGTSWSRLPSGGASFSTGVATYFDFAINPVGAVPTAVYSDSASDKKPNVMQYASSWGSIGTLGPTSTQSIVSSIAFSSTGVPYVAYQDATDAAYKITVDSYNSGWSHVGSASFTADMATWIGLALDSANVPYVAYIDYFDDGVNPVRMLATVMKNTGAGASGWELVGYIGLISTGVEVGCLDFAISGTIPYVAFSDTSNGYRASVMKLNGTAWESIGTRGFSGSYVGYLSLAVDSTGKPYVAYRDTANSNKLTVMVYK